MTVISTASTAPSTTTSTSASTSSAGVSISATAFLKLLTTELQHQDPTAPMDSTQYVTQLAQLSAVQQATTTNTNLQSLITLTQNNEAIAALGYVGNTVQVSGNDLALQNGAASATYTLKNDAGNVTVAVQDSSGHTVYSTQGATTAGPHNFTWNGKDSSGTQLADGAYKINVVATDPSGNAVSSTTTTTGKVTGVSTANNTISLQLGGVTTPLSNVLSIQKN